MNIKKILIVHHKDNALVQETIAGLQQQLNELQIAYCFERDLIAQLVACGVLTREMAGAHDINNDINNVDSAAGGLQMPKSDCSAPCTAHLVGEIRRKKLLDLYTKIPTLAIDLVISVGGDGCFLAAAQWAMLLNVPIVGVNCGRIGFLGDLSPQRLFLLSDTPPKPSKNSQPPHALSISDFFANSILEERTVLQIDHRMAVNEVLVAGSYPGALTTLQVEVDGRLLCTYQADGLIIATATGSTGHALSCGGPILEPASRQVVLTPLASHRLQIRPLVVTPKHSITIRVPSGQVSGGATGAVNAINAISAVSAANAVNAVNVAIDGQRYAMQRDTGGDTFKTNRDHVYPPPITITMPPQKLQVLHPIDYDFFAVLRTKLEW